jgi:hypothetical protein
MDVQILIVAAAVAVAGLFFGRKAFRSLGRKAGCGCCGGGACGRPRR